METKPNLCGMILVDKPVGMTSHQIVSYFRKNLPVEKVGHLGTLDPFASGLLPILLGGATRLSDEILGSKKQYLFTIQLGTETDTLDIQGKPIATAPVPSDFYDRIVSALPGFHGQIEQVPPVYSALKMNGQPLYAYMRGVGQLPLDIETKKRMIEIHSIDIVSFHQEASEITLRVLCGKGTYVRSLSRDIAKKIGTLGFCKQLRREFLDPHWHVDDAVVFLKDNPPGKSQLIPCLVPPEKILPNVPHFFLKEKYTPLLRSGNVCLLDKEELVLDNDPVLPLSAFISSNDNETMYYGFVEHAQTDGIKICPKKKMY